MDDREQSVQHFLDLIKRSHRGKFKIYIGMIAGVGKSYRMLPSRHPHHRLPAGSAGPAADGPVLGCGAYYDALRQQH